VAGKQRKNSQNKAQASAVHGGEKQRGSNVSKPGNRAFYQPNSYTELVRDAAIAAEAAMAQDGHTRLEVEFPAIPGESVGYTESSDSVIDANISHALGLAKQLDRSDYTCQIVLPDAVELDRASERFRSAVEDVDKASLGCLSPGGIFKRISQAVMKSSRANQKEELALQEARSNTDVFIVTNLSTQELPSLEAFINDIVGANRPLISLNNELDTLRGDLGLPAFPPKDLHYRFLCFFLPAFYLRQRTYSRTISTSPFVISYSGALFREYPGKWQVMLKQDSGELCCVAERIERYALGEVREELTKVMGLEGAATQERLRQGAKSSTWWEVRNTSALLIWQTMLLISQRVATVLLLQDAVDVEQSRVWRD